MSHLAAFSRRSHGPTILCAAILHLTGCSSDTFIGPRITEAHISPAGSIDLVGGDSILLSVTAINTLGETIEDPGLFIWSTRNPSLVTVTQTGKVTAIGGASGTTYVTATIVHITDSIAVHVTASPAANAYLWPSMLRIIPGMARQMTVESFSASSGITTLTGASWTSSEATVATVDANGLVTARALGHTTVTTTVGTRQITADVDVFAYSAPLRFTSISLGDKHACGVTTTHEAYCWGANDHNQLASVPALDVCESVSFSGSVWQRAVISCSGEPRRINLTDPVADVQATAGGACAVTTTNAVYCWGNIYGLTNDGPTRLAGSNSNFTAISPGSGHACGIGVDSLAYCWGTEHNGARGDGPGSTTSYAATPVVNNKSWRAISAHNEASCALDGTGVPYCWGVAPVTGTLGVNSSNCTVNCTESPTKVAVDAPNAGVRFTQIVATGGHNCALTITAQLYCWGGDEYGTGRAIGITAAVAQPAGGLANISAPYDISPGHVRPICGVTTSGSAYCAYYSPTGPVDSAFRVSALPVGVPLATISYRQFVGCGVALDGFAYCWGGAGAAYMLGNGSLGPFAVLASAPTKIVGQ